MFVVQTVEIARATRVGVARAGRVDSRSKIDMKRKGRVSEEVGDFIQLSQPLARALAWKNCWWVMVR